MEETVEPPENGGRPLHLWVVGLVSLLWNAFGAFDYTMTNLRDPGYLANFPLEMMDVIDTFPMWTVAAWAFGVWGALAGSILLLLRSRYAVHAFAVSLLGLAASTFYQFGIDLPSGMAMGAMTVAIWIIAVGLLLYAFRLSKEGVLR